MPPFSAPCSCSRCAYAAAVEFQEAWYQPLEAREDALAAGAPQPPSDTAVGLAVVGELACDLAELAAQAAATNAGLSLSRDLCSGSPERHTPLRVAASVQRAFAGTAVSVEVVSGRSTLEAQYPLLAAVDRASAPRHAGCVVKLSYMPGLPAGSLSLSHSLFLSLSLSVLHARRRQRAKCTAQLLSG
jgi:leucyl aminopeptidase